MLINTASAENFLGQQLNNRIQPNKPTPNARLDERKNNMNSKLGSSFIKERKVGNNTAVFGYKKHVGNVNESGSQVEANGVELNLKGKGTVRGNVTMMQIGNVTADGEQSATASGVKVETDANSGSGLNVRSIVHGNVSATADGRGNVKAEATGTRVKGAKAALINSNTTGRIDASARAR
jgi:hypothetical protein